MRDMKAANEFARTEVLWLDPTTAEQTPALTTGTETAGSPICTAGEPTGPAPPDHFACTDVLPRTMVSARGNTGLHRDEGRGLSRRSCRWSALNSG
eukprot:12698506-Alexandrium_andersonii.AAC.2